MTGLQKFITQLEEEINRYTNNGDSPTGERIAHKKGLYRYRKMAIRLEAEEKAALDRERDGEVVLGNATVDNDGCIGYRLVSVYIAGAKGQLIFRPTKEG